MIYSRPRNESINYLWGFREIYLPNSTGIPRREGHDDVPSVPRAISLGLRSPHVLDIIMRRTFSLFQMHANFCRIVTRL